jgi:hypothetical protein
MARPEIHQGVPFMSTVTFTGLPAMAWALGFVILGSLPVWLAAKVTGAGQATLLRAAAALLAGTVVAFVALMATGPWAMILAPLGYLLSFKFIMDTSFLGAVLLGILALAGYAAMDKVMGGSVAFS